MIAGGVGEGSARGFRSAVEIPHALALGWGWRRGSRRRWCGPASSCTPATAARTAATAAAAGAERPNIVAQSIHEHHAAVAVEPVAVVLFGVFDLNDRRSDIVAMKVSNCQVMAYVFGVRSDP